MRQFICTAALVAASSVALFAQAGYSNASLGMGKSSSQYAPIPQSKSIFVEEYFNYRRHALPTPTGKETVKLDMRWGSNTATKDGEALLQIGITTARLKEAEIPPVNLCVVLDRSGSMQGDRIRNTREATKELVSHLRPQDRISVVLFDNVADILVPSQLVTDKAAIIQLLDGVQERGGTNLNAGLQLGYKEVAAHYGDFGSNKIIFLTDAIANLGITDPMDMLRQAGVYQKQMQIDLTMIGVGSNFNAELSRVLTAKGHSIHFVMDSRDIKKIFIDELESLLSPIGREVELVIEWDEDLDLQYLYGYSPKTTTRQLTIPINNMNSGLTQISLANFKLNDRKGEVRARLSWKDALSQQPLSASASATIRKGNALSIVANDTDVKINYDIAEMARAMHEAALLFEGKKHSEAEKMLSAAVKRIQADYPTMNDDVKLVFDILNGYNTNMQNYKP
jgi:Ca-activated chloride channel homolog